MKRILFFVLLFFLLIPFVAAEDNANLDVLSASSEYYVSVDGSLNATGSIDDPFADIRTAIDKSSSNDIIYVNGGIYSGINNTQLSVSITNLTIKAVEGQNVIIDANKSNIFTINEDYFTISNITFINAHSIAGSCLDVWSRYVTISDCDFINDVADIHGGAVSIRNNFLTIDNCNFINCSSFGSGGALHLEGAQIFVLNSNFINCSASNAGAINWFRKSSYLYNSTFINCSASEKGGAMCVNENTIDYSNITVINCHAKNGAVIYGPEFRGSISNSLFANNSAEFGAVFRVFFDSDLKLSNITLINNKASSTSILFNITQNANDVEIIATFSAKNSMINAFYNFKESQIIFDNVTYWGIDGVMNTGYSEGFVEGAENSEDGKLIYADKRQANQNITIEVFDANGNLIENVTNATDILGNVNLRLNNLSCGIYKVKAYHYENEYYTFISNSQEFSISNDNIKLETNDLDMYYHDGSKFIMNLTNNNQAIANATININLNGINYTRVTDEEGLASITINLDSGAYAINCSYVDENNLTYASDAVIVIKATVDASNLTKIYRNDSQFYAIFTDFTGHHLANINVTFNINGVFYNRTTNSVGVARLNINLEQGNYTITSINPLTGENAANLVCVLPSITQNKDVVKYYRNATQYVVCIVDGEGNPVSGENVTFNINGVFYSRASNSTGHIKLNINLQPGYYTITAEYNGCRVSNNIEVLPVLSADNLTKSYGSSDPFKCSLVDGVGNPLAGENITFNINGIFYDRITDDGGIAKLNINLQSGEYLITSSYNQSNIANRVTVI